MPNLYLEIRAGSDERRLPLGDQPVTIGRHPDNVLVIDDDRASRFHCVVEPSDPGYRVRDLGSRNGTRINDARIEIAPLRHGDEFRIGRTRFRFIDPAAPPPPVPVEPAASSAEPDSPRRAPDLHGTARPASARSAAAVTESPSLASVADEATDYNSLLADLLPSTSDTPRPGLDFESAMRRLADTGKDESLSESDIALVNSRGDLTHTATARPGEAPSARRAQKDDDEETAEGIRALRLLVLVALRTRATDIHIEPKADNFHVRLRVDGTMVDAVDLEKPVAARLLGVVKVLCEIDIAQRNIVQEGHFVAHARDRRMDYRVSFTPSVFGQKLVIRVLDLANAPQFMHDLELPPWMFETVRRVSRQDAGMILSCGPTGSGKTTTLYAVLRDIDVKQRNVITIEDPVEYQIEGVTQIPIDNRQGNTFNTLLRSVLRQDPDVILLGEIRDKETAATAMQAAMTGHLVLSTVHAKDTIGTVFRLLDLGVEAYLVASSLNILLAQRLIRMLCPACKAPRKPTPAQVMRMGKYIEGINQVFYPVGCPKCLNTGYLGRRAIFETLVVSDDLRDVILKTPTIQAMRDVIKMQMFTSLQQSGFQLVLDGVTSNDEIERVTGTE